MSNKSQAHRHGLVVCPILNLNGVVGRGWSYGTDIGPLIRAGFWGLIGYGLPLTMYYTQLPQIEHSNTQLIKVVLNVMQTNLPNGDFEILKSELSLQILRESRKKRKKEKKEISTASNMGENVVLSRSRQFNWRDDKITWCKCK